MLILVDLIEKYKNSSNKYKNIKKSRNKIIKILAKQKSWNLPKFKLKICLSLKKFKILV